MSSQTHLLGADRTCRNTVVLTPSDICRILAHRPRFSKLTQKPHTSTVNRTRPTRFPHSNNHAPPDCVNTIFPENDFSSGFYICTSSHFYFLAALVGFLFRPIPSAITLLGCWLNSTRSRFSSRISQQCQQQRGYRIGSLWRRNR